MLTAADNFEGGALRPLASPSINSTVRAMLRAGKDRTAIVRQPEPHREAAIIAFAMGSAAVLCLESVIPAAIFHNPPARIEADEDLAETLRWQDRHGDYSEGYQRVFVRGELVLVYFVRNTHTCRRMSPLLAAVGINAPIRTEGGQP